MLSRLFIAALWSPAGKGLTSWLLLVMFIVFLLFPCGFLGQVWYFIVSFPDLCRLSYFGHVEHSCGAVITACDLQVDGRWGPCRLKMTRKKLTENDCHEWKPTTVHSQERNT